VDLPTDGLRVVSRLTVTEGLEPGEKVSFTIVPLGDALSTYAFGPEAR
jgi:hypothetical protein